MHRTWVKITAIALAALMALSGITVGLYTFFG